MTNPPARCVTTMEVWWTYGSQTLGDFNVFFVTGTMCLVFLILAWIGVRRFADTQGSCDKTQDAAPAPSRPAGGCPFYQAERNDSTFPNNQQATKHNSTVKSTQNSTSTTPATLLTIKSHTDASSQRSARDSDSRSQERNFRERNAGSTSEALTALAGNARSQSGQRHPVKNFVHGDSGFVSTRTVSAFESSDAGTLQRLVLQRKFSVAGWLKRKLSDVSLYLKAQEGIHQKYLHAEIDISNQAVHSLHEGLQPETSPGQEPRADDLNKPFCSVLATSPELQRIKAVAAEFAFVPFVDYCDTKMSKLLTVLGQKHVVQIPEFHSFHHLARDLQATHVGNEKRQSSDHGGWKFQASDLVNVKAHEVKEVGAGFFSSFLSIRSTDHILTDMHRDPHDVKSVRFADQHRRHVSNPSGFPHSNQDAESRTFADDGSGLSNDCNRSSPFGLASHRGKGTRLEVCALAWKGDNNQWSGEREETNVKVPGGYSVLQRQLVSQSCLAATGRSSCTGYAVQSDTHPAQEPDVNFDFWLAFYKRVAFTLVTFRFGDLQTGVELGQVLLCCVYVHLASVCCCCPLLKQAGTVWRLLKAVVALDFPSFQTHARSFFFNIRVLLAGCLSALRYILTGSLILFMLACTTEALAFFLTATADVIARFRERVRRQWRRLLSGVKRRMWRCLWEAVIRPLAGAALLVCDVCEWFVPGNTQ